jgi:hypothetical protein
LYSLTSCHGPIINACGLPLNKNITVTTVLNVLLNQVYFTVLFLSDFSLILVSQVGRMSQYFSSDLVVGVANSVNRVIEIHKRSGLVKN